MAKTKPQFSIKSYGIYTSWDERSKDLPKILSYTTDVSAKIDIEFGYILNVKKGKGIKLNFTIYHPNVLDKKGQPMEPFTGDIYVKTNDWDFYLGDTLWEPLYDKLGDWRIIIEYNNTIISDKTFQIIDEEDYFGDSFTRFQQSRKTKKLNKRAC